MASVPLNLEPVDAPRYIAVEGPIGAGKTTLARRLAESFGYPLMLEPAAENPFLDRFYREGGRHALPTQLFFLLHRAQQFNGLGSNSLFSPNLVADFLMAKDRLFAEVTLDANEMHLYEQIQESLAIEAPTPDLVIYLQAPTNILIDRIRRRGVPAEQTISTEYLIALIDAYTRFFHFYNDSPLLIINAAEVDLANNEDQYLELLDHIRHMTGMRSYYNPQPTLI
jgi:deoxyadenosine/deoxycytidine kinase